MVNVTSSGLGLCFFFRFIFDTGVSELYIYMYINQETGLFYLSSELKAQIKNNVSIISSFIYKQTLKAKNMKYARNKFLFHLSFIHSHTPMLRTQIKKAGFYFIFHLQPPPPSNAKNTNQETDFYFSFHLQPLPSPLPNTKNTNQETGFYFIFHFYFQRSDLRIQSRNGCLFNFYKIKN